MVLCVIVRIRSNNSCQFFLDAVNTDKRQVSKVIFFLVGAALGRDKRSLAFQISMNANNYCKSEN